MNKSIVAFSAAALLCLAPIAAHAAACPGTQNRVTGGTGNGVVRFGSGTATKMFVNSGNNCTGQAALMGTTNCIQFEDTTADMHVIFFGFWANQTARLAAVGGGCNWTCPGGTCFENNTNGLPVELLNFGID